MPRTSSYSITLNDAERAERQARARRYTSPYSEVVRARIVLYAAAGLGNDEIAARLDTQPRTQLRIRSSPNPTTDITSGHINDL